MSKHKLVPLEPIMRAIYALERFANDTLAGRNSAHELRELLAAAPAVQGEPVFMWHRGATDDESEVVDVDCACPCCVPLYTAQQPAEQHPDVTKLVEALEEGLRAIGEHHAPGDCYATGPMTGDPFRDLVQCPACSFIAMCDDLPAAHRKGGGV